MAISDDVRAELERMLDPIYKPEGLRIWMTAKHSDWGLTVEEMAEAGRFDEVWIKAASLKGQVAT